MKILYDTSVLIAASVSAHPRHEECNRFFNLGKSGNHEMVICSHSIAESFSALTRLLVQPRISPNIARQIIKENLLSGTRIVSLVQVDYLKALDIALDTGISGGTIYDALLLVVARKERVAKIATLNTKHFLRMCPEEPDFIQSF